MESIFEMLDFKAPCFQNALLLVFKKVSEATKNAVDMVLISTTTKKLCLIEIRSTSALPWR